MSAASTRRDRITETDRRCRRRNAALFAQLGTPLIDKGSILDGIPGCAMPVRLLTDSDSKVIEASAATGGELIGKGHNAYGRHLAPGKWAIEGEPPAAE